jgi:predicted Abi (CAAX) family protease
VGAGAARGRLGAGRDLAVYIYAGVARNAEFPFVVNSVAKDFLLIVLSVMLARARTGDTTASSAVFPTSTTVNPQLTVMALAAYAADEIRA